MLLPHVSSSISLSLVKTPTPLVIRWQCRWAWLVGSMFLVNSVWSGGTPDPAEPVRLFPGIALFLLRSLSWEREFDAAVFPAMCSLSAAVSHDKQRGEHSVKEVGFLKLLLQFYGVTFIAFLAPRAFKFLFCLSPKAQFCSLQPKFCCGGS